MNTEQLYNRGLQFVTEYNKIGSQIKETANSLHDTLTDSNGDPYDRIDWDDLPAYTEDDLATYKVLSRKAIPLAKTLVQILKVLESVDPDMAEKLEEKIINLSDEYTIQFLAKNFNLKQEHLKLL